MVFAAVEAQMLKFELSTQLFVNTMLSVVSFILFYQQFVDTLRKFQKLKL